MLRRFLPVLVLVFGLSAMAIPAEAVIAPDLGCRNGRVAITFDDGPNPVYTPRLLRVLKARHAQATFFVEGQFAARYPSLLRRMIADGHAVENHSWDHPEFFRHTNRHIGQQVSRTTRAIVKATGVRPKLMRPPYGETDHRIRKIIARQGLSQELWTIDTNDWRGGSARKIRKAALKGLRKHRTNVILMHDGVTNSKRTVKAVPSIIKGARKRGYCLVPLQITAPFSRVTSPAITVDEGTSSSTRVKVTFRLNTVTQQNSTFRIRTVAVSAQAGIDFVPVSRTLTLRRGAKSVTTYLRVFPDPMPNPRKVFRIDLDLPKHLILSTKSVPVTITDNGAWDSQRSLLIAQR